jgi:hypothetical protein
MPVCAKNITQWPTTGSPWARICLYHPGFLSCTSGFLRPFASNYVHHRAVLISSSAAHMLEMLWPSTSLAHPSQVPTAR